MRTLSPRKRRYLRDYPPDGQDRPPVPSHNSDVLVLVDTGILACRGAMFHLTLLGQIAQREIWRAERYVAVHYPAFE